MANRLDDLVSLTHSLSRQYKALISAVPSDQSTEVALKSISKRTRYNFAWDVYKACCSTEASAGQAILSTYATWVSILRRAIQHTS